MKNQFQLNNFKKLQLKKSVSASGKMSNMSCIVNCTKVATVATVLHLTKIKH